MHYKRSARALTATPPAGPRVDASILGVRIVLS